MGAIWKVLRKGKQKGQTACLIMQADGWAVAVFEFAGY